MDANLKAKWVEALRSGQYQQAQGSLIEHYDNYERRFCCLGVLCDVLGTEWGVDVGYENGLLNGKKVRSNNGSYLAPNVLRLVGFDDRCQRSLTEMNDSGQCFPAIADYIERHL